MMSDEVMSKRHWEAKHEGKKVAGVKVRARSQRRILRALAQYAFAARRRQSAPG